MKKKLLILVAVFLCSCSGVEIVYDRTLEQMTADAKKSGEDFCVILSRTDCPPCGALIENLNSAPSRKLFGKAVFNVVDVQLPENSFYLQWLYVGSFPTTCVFSSDGKLKAVVSGATRTAMECIGSAKDGDTKCADYFYSRHYPISGNYLTMLNELLACKQRLDRGEDVGADLDRVLSKTYYPYPVYLKAINEEKQGRHDSAVNAAERLLEFHETQYLYLYSDLFLQAKYLVNPDYKPEQDGILAMEEEILLADCKVGEPRKVTIRVENPGEFPAFIRDIQMSCTCLELLSSKQHKLEPGEAVDIDVEFTAESRGEVYREVMFFSNSSQPIRKVALRAMVS